MLAADPADGRRYGGRSLPQRRADRRRRLLDAALDLFGTTGYAGVPIERLCAAASVATRSFYEEFPGREQLLLAVYEEITSAATMAVTEALEAAPRELAPRVQAGLSAYVGFVTSDPRRARIAHQEARAAGLLEGNRHAAVVAFAAIIEREALAVGAQRGAADGRLLALALAGAANELLVDWTTSDPRPPTEPILRQLCQLFVAALT
ncbi:MAG: TetR/AcrR family transcriptional regulator [Actinomycetota bacterium]|nr:TetR/AcrR family transcriptional regulator [Actinomycetota bacterium]